jgi:competence ComEA-like helix-hairpin-helix protein
MTHAESEWMPRSRRRLLWLAFGLWSAAAAIRVLADGTAAAAGPPRPRIEPRRIDVDRARLAELRLLPGIGPERAEALVLERVRGGAFGRVEALARVPGIGAATVEQLRAYVRAGPDPDPHPAR